MSTLHISAEKGDFGKVVLMPGDPNRAKYIAEHFLTNAKEVTNVRGIVGYTGYTNNGKRISVMASGMGQPSIGIFSYDLYSYFGVEAIIRIGTCGSYHENIDVKDLLICSGSCTDSNWSVQYNIPQFSATADLELAMAAYECIKKRNLPIHYGPILSSDVFYDDNKERWKDWAKLGVMGVEMESYALYCNALRLRKKALCLLTVTDHFVKGTRMPREERVTKLTNMVEVAIEVAEKFAD